MKSMLNGIKRKLDCWRGKIGELKEKPQGIIENEGHRKNTGQKLNRGPTTVGKHEVVKCRYTWRPWKKKQE